MVDVVDVLVVIPADHREQLELGHAHVLTKAYAQSPSRKPLDDEVDVAQVRLELPEDHGKSVGVRRGPPLERGQDEDCGVQYLEVFIA